MWGMCFAYETIEDYKKSYGYDDAKTMVQGLLGPPPGNVYGLSNEQHRAAFATAFGG